MSNDGRGQIVERPLISAIIPTRNRAVLLPRALDSVYAQEGIGEQFDLEVVIVDDASTDATPDVVTQYPPARYIRLSTPRGASGARNAGIAVSGGALIAFLDDDDLWLPHRLRVQLEALVRHPEAGAVYSQFTFSPAGGEWPPPDLAASGWIFTDLLETNLMAVPSVLIRREALEQAGYFDESLMSYEDYNLWLRLSFHSQILYVPGAVAVYNLRPQGLWLSRSASGRGADDAARAVEQALQLLPDSPRYAEVKREARARAAVMGVYALFRLSDLQQAWERVVTALRACPYLLRYDWARDLVMEVARIRAAGAQSPVSATREMCSQIKRASPRPGATGWWARQVVAWIWEETAYSLAFDLRRNARDVAYAAVCAVAHSPRHLPGKMLIRASIRSVLGPHADDFCVKCYTKVKCAVMQVLAALVV